MRNMNRYLVSVRETFVTWLRLYWWSGLVVGGNRGESLMLRAGGRYRMRWKCRGWSNAVSSLSQGQTPRDEVSIDRILLLSYSGQTVLTFIPKF
jgi:hypothetical protein